MSKIKFPFFEWDHANLFGIKLVGFIARLGWQNATRMCNIIYKAARAGVN